MEAGWAGGETGRKWPFKGLTLAKESRPRRWEKGQERCLHTEAEAFPAAARVWGLRSLGRQAEMAAQITCLVRRQQDRSHRT